MNDYKDLNDYEIMYMISENDDDAKRILIEKYYPLIHKLARAYYQLCVGSGLEIDDFVQEGYFALFSAIRNYSEGKDCLFYTYAMVSIRSRMINLIVKSKNNKNLSLNTSVSLNEIVSIDSNVSFMDLIPDNKALLPNIELERRELEEILKNSIFELDIIQGAVLELKLNGFTNRSISTLLSITQRTVSNALVKIKKNLSLLIEKKDY